MRFNPAVDLFPLAAAVLAALTCGLLGNFLVLRRQSLMGDAISHAVLPGLVVAFLISSSRSPLLMLAGAAIAGVVAVVLIEMVKKLGRVEPGAAMGVVFSIMFAFGVLMIEQAAARHVDLDADCLLYGQLENLFWFGAPPTFAELWAWSTVEAIPRQVWLLLIVAAAAVVFVTIFFKELRIAAFDPELSTSQGIHAGVMHYALMVLVAAATVASFEAVGSILVIAMLIAPAAAARLLTDRLVSQVIVSLIVAMVCGVGGYYAATAVTGAFGAPSVNAAGSMTVLAGLLVFLAAMFSPSHGIVARRLRQAALARASGIDDLLLALYRFRETGQPLTGIKQLPNRPGFDVHRALRRAVAHGLIEHTAQRLRLTETGLARATQLMRRHRLWEDYLVHEAGLEPDHVHHTAAQLEHLDTTPVGTTDTDPHGKPIPRG